MPIAPSPSSQAAPALSDAHALFLDFDGTLAPLQDDPDTVALPPGGAECLMQIAGNLSGALVLISGRSIHDLSLRTPEFLWRAGGHGVDVCAPGGSPRDPADTAPTRLIEAVTEITSSAPGSRLEIKGKVLAVHYRQVPEIGAGLADQLQRAAADHAGYKCQHGKMVIELKPIGTDKGTALRALMHRAPFAGRSPIMVGDDTTDEDAMAAAIDLGGIGIKVGAGETCAQHRLPDTDAVWAWLNENAGKDRA